MNKKFPAMLDQGSAITFIGDKIIDMLENNNHEFKEERRKIGGFFASNILNKYVDIDITLNNKTANQKCVLAPGHIDYVLLGRDFFSLWDIIPYTLDGGFKMRKVNKDFIPFIDFEGPFTKSAHTCDENVSAIIFESAWLDDLSNELEEDCTEDYIPAAVLTAWANELNDCDEEDDDMALEEDLESLFPEKEEFLLVPSELEEDKKEKLRNVIRPYLSMFTSKPGFCDKVKHRILTPGANPVQVKYQPMSKGKREAFDETFDQLVEWGVIEPSSSPWAANAFVKQNKDNSYRFLVNFKGLNKVTKVDKYPIPCIDTILSHLGAANYFSSADCVKGYFQLAIDERDKEKSAFRSHKGLWQFTRVAQGMINSPATFQRCVDQILTEYLYIFAFCFFDDSLTYSKTFDEHCEHIDKVFKKFFDAGFTFSPKKVQLCRRRLKYLGFIIEPGKISPNPDKVKRIAELPIPECLKDLQSFLGGIGFYRRFIEEFAHKALPLYKISSPKVDFEWNEKCQKGFEELKNGLINFTQVYLPDLNKEFIITCDGSRTAIAACLAQERDGVRYPVYFASRALRPAESKAYSVSELELAAIIFGITKYRQYIELTHFIIETDHRAISFLQNLKNPSGRLARWFMTLQSYSFEVRYKPGTNGAIKVADMLSRVENLLVELPALELDRKKIIEEQNKDQYLKKIKQCLLGQYSLSCKDGRMMHSISKKALLVEDGLLLKYVGAKNKIWEDEGLFYRVWIPDSLKQQVIQTFHSIDLAAHLGRRKTYSKLEQRVFWNGMSRDVDKFVGKCVRCAQAKMPHIKPVPSKPNQPEAAWDVVSIDFLGSYVKSQKQNRYILVILDNFTKWVEIFPLRQATSKAVINALKSVFLQKGFPRVIISDNANQFASRMYIDYLNSIGAIAYYIPPYHPQVNTTERYNLTIKNMIRATMKRNNDWDRCLPEIAFAHNTSVNDTTGFTPAYLNYGRELRHPFDNMVGAPLSRVKETRELQERMILIHDIARENMIKQVNTSLTYKNKNAKERTFEKGDIVWVKTHILSSADKGISAGLMPKLEGPYRVEHKFSEHIFDLIHTETDQLNSRVHINDIVKCKE